MRILIFGFLLFCTQVHAYSIRTIDMRENYGFVGAEVNIKSDIEREECVRVGKKTFQNLWGEPDIRKIQVTILSYEVNDKRKITINCADNFLVFDVKTYSQDIDKVTGEQKDIIKDLVDVFQEESGYRLKE